MGGAVGSPIGVRLRTLWGWLGPLCPHTCVIDDLVQQANFVQMDRSGDRERQHIPDGLMETRVGTLAQGDGLVLVLQVVLNVTHLVVHCGQLLHRDPSALLDPGVGKGEGEGEGLGRAGAMAGGGVGGEDCPVLLVEMYRRLALPQPTSFQGAELTNCDSC